METIKVNMSPNPLDVQTIHASQNDSEARQWEFELHNNGELIDTSEITEQLFFKSYKGGTEQILPENTSTPTTSPFLGDIRYPQGLLTDQEFTYRQSPTEEDGLAKITDIKGNTLVWNQLYSPAVLSGDTSGVTRTQTAEGLLTLNGTANATGVQILSDIDFPVVSGHKYLVKTSKALGYQCLQLFNVDGNVSAQAFGNQNAIYSATASFTARIRLIVLANQTYSNISCYINIFDLTKMGIDSITSADEFTSLFPLSYYSYNQGSLLSFNGNGIKTVGKNQLAKPFVYNSNSFTYADGFRILKGNYTFSFGEIVGATSWRFDVKMWDLNGTVITDDALSPDATLSYNNNYKGYLTRVNVTAKSIDLNITQDCFIRICFALGDTSSSMDSTDAQLEFGSTATSYEPYTSSTLSLPISTYFSTGMKSARYAYDELTPTKTITRIGAVDLGTLTWERTTTQGSDYRFFSSGISSVIKKPNALNDVANIICSKYQAERGNGPNAQEVGVGIHTNGNVLIYDTAYASATAEAFKTAMSGFYLYYELKTPTETPITTASLVTENAEIPLSNEDGVLIGKCTEQLSENPGFIDAKIKLNDADGTCYSNKIQLHVERKP